MEDGKQILKRWKARGVVSLDVLKMYDEPTLLEFLNTTYLTGSRSTKSIISNYISLGYSISPYNEELAKELFHTKLSNNAKTGFVALKTKLGAAGVSNLRKLGAVKGRKTRISRHPELSAEDALHRSYILGLEQKGRKIANLLSLENLTDAEYVKLSGYAKRENFSKLSEDEKHATKLRWKRSNLKNKNVLSTLFKYNPNIYGVNVDDLSDIDVELLYKEYVSIKAASNLTLNYIYKWCKRGYYTSLKSNKTLYYRSSYELKMFCFLDDLDAVVEYESEPYHIKLSIGKRYVPDIVCQLKSGKTIILEIKPDFKIEEFLENKGNCIKELLGSDFYIIKTSIIDDREKLNEYFENIK